MENVIVNGKKIGLETLRKSVADAVVRAYGAERKYSAALNATFTGFDWFDIEASDTSEQAKLVHAEKKALYAELKKANHSNPSTVWARIRKYGKEERRGNDEGSEDTASDSNGAGSAPRSALVRNIEELTALYKFNGKQENLPSKVVDAQKHIAYALAALGVDLSMVK